MPHPKVTIAALAFKRALLFRALRTASCWVTLLVFLPLLVLPPLGLFARWHVFPFVVCALATLVFHAFFYDVRRRALLALDRLAEIPADPLATIAAYSDPPNPKE